MTFNLIQVAIPRNVVACVGRRYRLESTRFLVRCVLVDNGKSQKLPYVYLKDSLNHLKTLWS